jgi:hypothetical protein
VLIGESVRFAGSPGQYGGGNIYGILRPQPSAWRLFDAGEAAVSAVSDKGNGLPNATEPPVSWCLPQKGGALAVYIPLAGAGSLTAGLSMGRALEAALSGSGDITAAALSLVVQLNASLAGQGDLTAALNSTIALAANLAGQGDLTAALGLIAFLSCDLQGVGSIDATLRGTASLAANLTSTGTLLTTQNVAEAVWGALATQFDQAGTMGEKLNDAGGSGNPWNTVIAAGITAEEVMQVLLAVAAGKLSGAPGGPIQIRNIGDTVTVVSANVDSNGNRNSTSIFPAP